MEWTSVISIVISATMMIIAIVTLSRNGRKDRKNEYVEESQKIEGIRESLIKANMKLDQLCATTVETRSDIKAMNEYINSVEKRVSVLEENIKAAWVRIDELKEKNK